MSGSVFAFANITRRLGSNNIAQTSTDGYHQLEVYGRIYESSLPGGDNNMTTYTLRSAESQAGCCPHNNKPAQRERHTYTHPNADRTA